MERRLATELYLRTLRPVRLYERIHIGRADALGCGSFLIDPEDGSELVDRRGDVLATAPAAIGPVPRDVRDVMILAASSHRLEDRFGRRLDPSEVFRF